MADNMTSDAHSNVETTDRGLFDFMKKKEGSDECKTSEAEVVTSGVANVHVSEPECKEEEEKKKHGGLLEKLHRSDSSSSSSSDEEGDDEEKKKKRKEKKEKKAGLTDKIKEKLGGHKEEHHGDTNVPIEKIHVEEHKVAAPAAPASTPPCVEEEKEKEKKGFLDKIKEKIPGFHSKGDAHEEKKDHD